MYVPKGVSVEIPLQSYFRLNAPGAGQFEHTLIIVDEGADLHLSRAVQHRNIMSPICMPDVWSFLWARMQDFVIRRLKTGPRICTI